MKKYTLDEITGAWYEAYGEYLHDDYAGFIEILKKGRVGPRAPSHKLDT